MIPLLRLIAVLGTSIALNACGEVVSDSKEQKQDAIFEARLGDTWDEVAQHSTLKVEPLPSPAGTIIDKVDVFIYRDVRHRMQLRNVRYITVTMNDETKSIMSFGIGINRESVDASQTWESLQEVISMMEKSGWIPDKERNKRTALSQSHEAIRTMYINLPGGTTGTEKTWRDDFGNEAWISLTNIVTDLPSGAEPRFNIVLQIQQSRGFFNSNVK